MTTHFVRLCRDPLTFAVLGRGLRPGAEIVVERRRGDRRRVRLGAVIDLDDGLRLAVIAADLGAG